MSPETDIGWMPHTGELPEPLSDQRLHIRRCSRLHRGTGVLQFRV
jgi:hypothetical protein